MASEVRAKAQFLSSVRPHPKGWGYEMLSTPPKEVRAKAQFFSSMYPTLKGGVMRDRVDPSIQVWEDASHPSLKAGVG